MDMSHKTMLPLLHAACEGAYEEGEESWKSSMQHSVTEMCDLTILLKNSGISTL